jgi:hypothetical protein
VEVLTGFRLTEGDRGIGPLGVAAALEVSHGADQRRRGSERVVGGLHARCSRLSPRSLIVTSTERPVLTFVTFALLWSGTSCSPPSATAPVGIEWLACACARHAFQTMWVSPLNSSIWVGCERDQYRGTQAEGEAHAPEDGVELPPPVPTLTHPASRSARGFVETGCVVSRYFSNCRLACPSVTNSDQPQSRLLVSRTRAGKWPRFHHPPAPGGRSSHIELGEFLRTSKGPKKQALVRLIGTLVEAPPFARDEA